MTASERYIITSALPYINGVKHLGNLVGSLLPADVYTRYLKLIGKDVIFICGTDEHGTPAELSALEAGMPVKDYCDKQYAIQKDIYERFGLSFDYFGRTSDQENTEITQEIFLALYKNGFISEHESEQLYSVKDKRYLPDRYVIGTCPHCGYERARGDQCESCTTLLNPTELINPQSVISGSKKLEKRQVKHFYIDLPQLQDEVSDWVEQNEQWSTTSLSIARKWLREGLKERSITRNLEWGIPVPLEGHEDLVFYVWFDAPIGYISITKKWAKLQKKPKLFDKYWKTSGTKLIQFMGIDNVPFHTVTWPCSIIGADLGYILADNVKGFQWLTYEKGKFSTSQGRGIFTDTALELFPADYWRYYLLLVAPERQDTDFQWKEFAKAVNSDLNNLLGNLLNRCITFIHRNFDGTIPVAKPGKQEKQLYTEVNSILDEYRETFDGIEFQKPVKALRRLWQEGNRYFQDRKPWETDEQETAVTVSTIAHLLRIAAIISAPIIPFSAEKIYAAFGRPQKEVHQERWDNLVNWSVWQGNEVPELKENLFQKISKKEVAGFEARFGSKTKEQSAKKKEKKKAQKKAATKPQEEIIEYDTFASMQLITAKVLKAKNHPDADHLLVLTLDDGKRQDRTVCAGIKGHYKLKDLVGRNVIIIDNLKPRKIRGIVSEGMVLAGEDDTGVHLLQPDVLMEPGQRIR